MGSHMSNGDSGAGMLEQHNAHAEGHHREEAHTCK